jgi:hypothetical protein
MKVDPTKFLFTSLRCGQENPRRKFTLKIVRGDVTDVTLTSLDVHGQYWSMDAESIAAYGTFELNMKLKEDIER